MTQAGSRSRRTSRRCPRGLALIVTVGGSVAPHLARAQDAVTYEIREQIAFALMPIRDYGVNGMCSTGTGVAPGSVFAQGGSGRGTGLGAGLGGRVGYLHLVSPPAERANTWWGLRVGAGLDLGLMYANVDTGIPDVTGQLCARLKTDGTQVGYQGSSVLLAQLSVLFGGQMGLGNIADDGAWHGVILGAAWAPALTYFKPWVSDGEGGASYLGTELTLDFATIAKGTAKESGKRVALYVLLPSQDHGPVVVTASFGVVWY
jgi:hypothetical protein